MITFYESCSVFGGKNALPKKVAAGMITGNLNYHGIILGGQGSAVQNGHIQDYVELSVDWYKRFQTFYRVYPGIFDIVLNAGETTLKHGIKDFGLLASLPDMPALSFEFPKNIDTGYATPQSVIIRKKGGQYHYWGCLGRYKYGAVQEVYGKFTIQDLINWDVVSKFRETRVDENIFMDYFALGVCHLYANHLFVDPVVFRRDEYRFEKSKNFDLVRKAWRRGICGFNLRPPVISVPNANSPKKSHQKSPHYRNWHLRKINGNFVFVSESFIHMDAIRNMPTGKYLEELEKHLGQLKVKKRQP